MAEVDAVSPNRLASILHDPNYSFTTRNDAANRLLRERDPRLAGELIRMLNDEKENLTWRNYCVQFLRSCEKREKQPEVLKALEDTCRHRLPELSSCALWGLAQLAVPRPWKATVVADHLPMFDQLTGTKDERAKAEGESTARTEGQSGKGEGGNTAGDGATTGEGAEANGEARAGEQREPLTLPSPAGRGEQRQSGVEPPHSKEQPSGEAPFENPLDRPLLPPESEAKARALALAWLSDDKAHLLTRTAGAQSCSRMGLRDAIPKLRELAAATTLIVSEPAFWPSSLATAMKTPSLL
jgi:hypothetical protein